MPVGRLDTPFYRVISAQTLREGTQVVLKMKELIARGDIGEVKAGWCRHFVGWGGDFHFKGLARRAYQVDRLGEIGLFGPSKFISR